MIYAVCIKFSSTDKLMGFARCFRSFQANLSFNNYCTLRSEPNIKMGHLSQGGRHFQKERKGENIYVH
jgi:hypothetical protein